MLEIFMHQDDPAAHQPKSTARADSVGDSGVDARQSPFYAWLDHASIRSLVERSLALSAGERLMVIKGLIPSLVDDMGLAEFDAFLTEVSVKAHRFQEAVDHPGEGRLSRLTPGEKLGGPMQAGHDHLSVARDPDHRGAREAERVVETELWARTEHGPPRSDGG